MFFRPNALRLKVIWSGNNPSHEWSLKKLKSLTSEFFIFILVEKFKNGFSRRMNHSSIIESKFKMIERHRVVTVNVFHVFHHNICHFKRDACSIWCPVEPSNALNWFSNHSSRSSSRPWSSLRRDWSLDGSSRDNWFEKRAWREPKARFWSTSSWFKKCDWSISVCIAPFEKWKVIVANDFRINISITVNSWDHLKYPIN